MLGDWKVPFRTLLDTTPDGILVCDQQGVLLLVNAEAERMFGYAPDELVGMSIDVLVPDRIRPRHARHMASYNAAPKVRLLGATRSELHGRRKDGSEFPVEISLSPYETERGVVVVGGVRDIGERKQLEAEINEANAHLVAAVEAVQDAFVMMDRDDRVLRANSAAVELFGDGTVGETFATLVRRAIARGMFDPGREPRDKLAERWLAYHRSPVGTFDLRTVSGHCLRAADRRTADGGTVSTIADVTDLLRARELAEAASAAKSQFLSSMSHELRTPLNSILGFAQLLGDDDARPLDERQRERVDHVIRGGEHLLRLIDDILDLSRIEDGRLAVTFEPVEIPQLMEAAARTLEPLAERASIALAISPPAGQLPTVLADRTRLLQILMNFTSNAIKYGRANGHVTLSATVRDDAVRIAVTDDGIGISDDNRAAIFEPFQRAGQETGPIEGTGIGLTISRRLATLMRATIDFTSTAGEGSTFWIDLPVREIASAPADARPFRLADSSLARGPARFLVLYVEDNPTSVAFMQDLVERLPSIELVVARTAEAGLDIVRARRPHLVLMDINLPGLDGYQATARLRRDAATRTLPIVGLSAAALAEDTARALAAGFDRYLTKPVKLAELARTLEELLA